MAAVLVLVFVALAAVLDLLGLTEVVPAVSRTALFVVPVIFLVSLVVGLSTRKQV